ncbi:Sec-independent protein translocase subunit TatA [Streptomyces corynorhini]|uniref:Sec-independent protein translocase protein TatA n=1 Tax=Streptomyces corynorhini TaxID=2282652 RepID=A0A370BAJ8_9ACTN|nr:Sec-independent protein translocase subunit TatA [Streptomyces corynorhini]RDG36465.1 twin-arginine translocase TatA/TatE family subunit [Streptomyces corynorhini]
MLRNGFEPWHMLVVAIVIIVLFGSKKLPDSARALGKSMRILKSEAMAMKEDGGTAASAAPAAAPASAAAPAAAPAPAASAAAESAAPSDAPGSSASVVTPVPPVTAVVTDAPVTPGAQR